MMYQNFKLAPTFTAINTKTHSTIAESAVIFLFSNCLTQPPQIIVVVVVAGVVVVVVVVVAGVGVGVGVVGTIPGDLQCVEGPPKKLRTLPET